MKQQIQAEGKDSIEINSVWEGESLSRILYKVKNQEPALLLNHPTIETVAVKTQNYDRQK